jgi:hypothetical protein
MVAALRTIYREACGELSDAAWLGACRVALRSCTHFPVPAELLAFVEEGADTANQERAMMLERARLDQAITDTNRLLAAGTVTPEQAKQNQERYEAMFAETMAAIKNGGAKSNDRSDWWSSGRRREGRRQMMPPLLRDRKPGPADA